MSGKSRQAVAPAPAGLSYASYLRVSDLIRLQEPRAEPAAHDELLFITVHQAYELWFKQILFELEAARDALLRGRLGEALHELGRVAGIERLLVAQVDVIESMRFQDFLEFRSVLDPASGFQSVQFREIEALSGRKLEGHLRSAETPEERQRLRRRLEEPSLWDAFRLAMAAAGLPLPEDDKPRCQRRLVDLMARPRDDQLQQVAETMVEHDELIAIWRWRHVLMVERQIGAKRGTGGSSGAGYLRATLEARFYPELWEARSDYLGGSSASAGGGG